MKLHLPKTLLAAVLLSLSAPGFAETYYLTEDWTYNADTVSGYDTIHVGSGVTLDANGQALETKSIILGAGGTLANTGVDIGTNLRQNEHVTLEGDATVHAAGNIAVIRENYWGATLDLATYTLKKTGDGIFYVYNAEVTQGTIDVDAGSVVFNQRTDAHHAGVTIADGTIFDVAKGAAVTFDNTFDESGDAVNFGNIILNAKGEGTFNFNNAVSIVGATGRENITTSQFAGTINMGAGCKILIGRGVEGEGYSQQWSVDLSKATIEMNGGLIHYNGHESKIGTLRINANGNFHAFDSDGTDATGLTIGTLDLKDNNLHLYNSWKISLDIDILTGDGGSLSIDREDNRTLIVNVNNMESGAGISSNSAVLNLGTGKDSNIALNNTIENSGAITVNGTLALDTENGAYSLYKAGEGAVYTHSDGKNGYLSAKGNQYYAILGGTANVDGAAVTVNGVAASLSQVTGEGAGYVFTDNITHTDYSVFYVNEGNIVAESEGFTDIYKAQTYKLADGTSFNLNGQYFAGKSFELGEGATLRNSGAGLNGNYEMLSSIELMGNATVHAASNMGLQAFSSSDPGITPSTLKLNGHTLNITGNDSGVFFLSGTNIEDAGTVKLGRGAIVQVGIEVNNSYNADTNAAAADFVFEGGSLNILRAEYNILTAQSISGNGTIVGRGVLNLSNSGAAQERVFNGDISLGKLQITGNDHYTFNGNLRVTAGGDFHYDAIPNGTADGYMKVHAGNLTLGRGTHEINKFDVSDACNSTSLVTLKSGAITTVHSNLWVADTAEIQIEDGASLSVQGAVKIEAKSPDANASITFGANSGDNYSLANANYTHSNARVTVATSDTNVTTLANKLYNSELVNGGTGTLTATHAGNVITGIDASTGNVNATVTPDVQTFSTLKIGQEKTVSVTTDGASAHASVTLNGTGEFAAGATLSANLYIESGSTVKLVSSLSLNRGTLTIGDDLQLDGDILSALSVTLQGKTVELFTDVSQLTLSSLESVLTDTISVSYTLADAIDLSTVFTNLESDTYYLGYDAERGVVYAGALHSSVPEPATATLSLLALAALTARRRRR